MKKLVFTSCLILTQIRTPGVNIESDRVGINLETLSQQFEILGLDNTLDHVIYYRTNWPMWTQLHDCLS